MSAAADIYIIQHTENDMAPRIAIIRPSQATVELGDTN